jgi:Nitrile hydratase, alpha chain
LITSKIEVNRKGEMQMSAAPSMTKRDLETALIEKCWKDPEFKKQIVADPKGMLERHIGQKLPANLKILIHEEDANTLHFSLPPAPSNATELSDEDLEKVAGGTELIVVATVAWAAVTVASAVVSGGVVTAKQGW